LTRTCNVAARRTPQGLYRGALAKRSAVDLAEIGRFDDLPCVEALEVHVGK
jgi:hypothetical protein